jgi:aldose 1-epimerase
LSDPTRASSSTTSAAGPVDAPLPLSGRASTIEHGPYRAEIAGVGATLRALTHDGRDLVVPFGVDEVRPLYRGALLAPWPNRVVDGIYDDQGVERQLPITEVERGHALHGLVQWAEWDVEHHTPDRVVLATRLAPSDGYPYRLDLRVEYRLDDEGLHTTVLALNAATGRAPYGVAPHPYLVAGEGRVDDWTLTLAADSYLEVTDDRLVPLGVHGVSERDGFDFRDGRLIGDLFVDHAFTDVAATAGGHHEARVTTADGTGVRMSWGRELPWVQVHTGDRPEPADHRRGLAVEPMTCPPDAFTSGVDLVHLGPGESHEASWSIAAIV